jgi:hypothetical protein
MLIHPPPMSNNERQRRFREGNPGYYARLHARKRSAWKAAATRRRVEAALAAAAPKREPLMLPAPAEPTEIPGRNTIGATPASASFVFVPLPVK